MFRLTRGAAAVSVLFLSASSLFAVAGTTDLESAADAIGARRISQIEFTGSGSSYAYEGEAATRKYTRVLDYKHQIDIVAKRATVDVSEFDDESNQELEKSRESDLSGPWEQQLDFWLNPFVFLNEAIQREVDIRPVHLLGTGYTRVSFDLGPKRELEGYINDRGELDRIRTWIAGEDGTLVPLEVSFRLYSEMRSLRFPGVIVWKEDGRLTRIISVTSASVVGR